MAGEIRPIPQATADCFESAKDVWNEAGRQVGEFGSQVGEFFSQSYEWISEQVSTFGGEAATQAKETYENASTFVAETASQVSEVVGQFFSDVATWVQENPAYAVAGLIGGVIAGFGIYFAISAIRTAYHNYSTYSALLTTKEQADSQFQIAERNFRQAEQNYLSAYGLRHMIEHNAGHIQANTLVAAQRAARQAELGNLNAPAVAPAAGQLPANLGEYRAVYDAASNQRDAAVARVAAAQLAIDGYVADPIFG